MADTVESLKEQIETAELAFGDLLSSALAFADNTTAAVAASEDMEQLRTAMAELVEKD